MDRNLFTLACYKTVLLACLGSPGLTAWGHTLLWSKTESPRWVGFVSCTHTGCALLTKSLIPLSNSTWPTHKHMHHSSCPCGLHPRGFSGNTSASSGEGGTWRYQMHRWALSFGLHQRLSLKCRAQLCSFAMVRGNSPTLWEMNRFQMNAGAGMGEQELRGDAGGERD